MLLFVMGVNKPAALDFVLLRLLKQLGIGPVNVFDHAVFLADLAKHGFPVTFENKHGYELQAFRAQ